MGVVKFKSICLEYTYDIRYGRIIRIKSITRSTYQSLTILRIKTFFKKKIGVFVCAEKIHAACFFIDFKNSDFEG